ncbi:hypothetical protein [Taklimakanibacter deserti]|uniref:hypothetical protein n=1 Tax=Taklimakanibacter deserti TaxID=2267839 RepID=UPI000E6468FB
MTSTPCQSAALDRIAPWAEKIAEFFALIVEIILMIAEKFPQRLPEGRALAQRTVLTAISSLRDVEARLPAAFGEHVHALARKSSPEVEQRLLNG